MLQAHHIHKQFDGTEILCDVSFRVMQGTTLSILGESGSGKTTLLKILAGLEPADEGQIQWAGRDLSAVPPAQRHMVYLYQEPLLFPHLNVADNLAFGLRLRSKDSREQDRQVDSMLEALELSEHRHKLPHQLSGGQQQRVNFGRALLVAPQVMLLDEPFSSLDTLTRQRMQQLYRQLAQERGLTTLFVTHDLKEALQMGDELATLRSGRWHSYASRDAFVADIATGAQAEIDFWTTLSPL